MTKREYLDFILEQLPEEVAFRPMMGEYLLYYRGKLFGGVYDNLFLVKRTAFSERFLRDSELVCPYKGAKPMLLVGELPKEELAALLLGMYPELPEKKK